VRHARHQLHRYAPEGLSGEKKSYSKNASDELTVVSTRLDFQTIRTIMERLNRQERARKIQISLKERITEIQTNLDFQLICRY
jgi:predicted protein tyrosine phosphatase